MRPAFGTHPPRLILILGAISAKDQVKVRDLDQLDAAFALVLARTQRKFALKPRPCRISLPS